MSLLKQRKLLNMNMFVYQNIQIFVCRLTCIYYTHAFLHTQFIQAIQHVNGIQPVYYVFGIKPDFGIQAQQSSQINRFIILYVLNDSRLV